MKPNVIAEIGQGKGDPEYVIRAMARAKQSGCWGAKVQLLQPETIAQADAPVYWDERRPEITGQRATFSTVGCLDYDTLPYLADAASEIGIEFVATPFDLAAVDAMAMAEVTWCKIASGDITNRPLIRAAADAFPHGIILSTGAAARVEILEALGWIADAGRGAEPWAVLACTLSYPTPESDAHLARIQSLRDLRAETDQQWHLGYSDHLVSPASSGWAVLAGATVLEKHYTLDDSDRSVPDNAFAVGPIGMDTYVDAANRSSGLLGSPTLAPVEVEQPARAGARRVLCATVDLSEGHEVTPADVTELRPFVPGAFVPAELPHLVGRRLKDPVAAGAPILLSAVI